MIDVTPIPKGVTAKKPRKPVAKVRKTPTATLKRKATVLHSQYVRARDGYTCRLCGGTTGQMQCAHIFSRRSAATRTDENNAVCLDAACHRRLTEWPDEHVAFFKWTVLGPDDFEALRFKALNVEGKVMKADFWIGEIERLERLLADLGMRHG